MSSLGVPRASGARLLVVDDDPAIRRVYRDVFERDEFDVVLAASCDQAMSRLDALEGDAQAFVVDLGLPDGDGAAFAREAAIKYGPRPTLFISGWDQDFWDLSEAPGHWLVMRKPVPLAKLRAAVSWLARGGAKPAELDAKD